MIAELKPYPAMRDSGVPCRKSIRADILALERETDGLLAEIVGGVP